MTFSTNSGYTSIASFSANDAQRKKGRNYFGFSNGAYHHKLRYDAKKPVSYTFVTPPAKASNTRKNYQTLVETAQVYAAGIICLLATTGLVALF